VDVDLARLDYQVKLLQSPPHHKTREEAHENTSKDEAHENTSKNRITWGSSTSKPLRKPLQNDSPIFRLSLYLVHRISYLIFLKKSLWAHLVSVGAIGGLDLEHTAPLRLDHQSMAQVQAGHRTGL
jgi:hypothetical protein